MPGEKFLQQNGSGGLIEVESVQTGGGAAADRILSLDSSGLLNIDMLPAGVGADTAVLEASEDLAAGDFVNIFNDNGTAKARKADASSITTRAHGFVLNAFTNTTTATVYLAGSNMSVTGQTIGNVFLSTTAGQATASAPLGSGKIVQRLGLAISATEIKFKPVTEILLA